MEIVAPLSKSEGVMEIVAPLSKSEGTVEIVAPFSKSEEAMEIAAPLSKSEEAVEIAAPLSKSERAMEIAAPLSKSEGAMKIAAPFSKSEGAMEIAAPFSKSEEAMEIAAPFSKTERAMEIQIAAPLSKSQEAISCARFVVDEVAYQVNGSRPRPIVKSSTITITDTTDKHHTSPIEIIQHRTQHGVQCVFCKRNGETKEFFTTHMLKDQRGVIVCPVLRAYTCPKCGATGDNAHTESHCPSNTRQLSIMATLRTRRSSTGLRFRYHNS